jgi:ribosomal-protein-alanine N-acetyltransferase
MTESDVSPVAAIEGQVSPAPWTEQIFHDCRRVGYTCVVVEIAEEIVGYGVLSMGAGEAHLLNICIAPQHQGQGMGRGLLLYMLNMARSNNVTMVLLEVRVSNKRAQQLYHDVGFNEAGTREAYYPAKEGREDAQVFAIEL